MTILNLTQHSATLEQLGDGVVDLPEPAKKLLVENLTFTFLPTKGDIEVAAKVIASIAANFKAPAALIGGAPYLMGPLEVELKKLGIEPCYAFSERVSEEKTLPSGEVVKTSAFRYKGLIWV